MADNFNFKVEIEFNQTGPKIMAAVERAFKACASELDGRFDEAIKGSHWDWPRETRRGLPGNTVGQKAKAWGEGKGNAVGSPRNIVDSGDLASRKMMNVSGLSAEWSWGIDYAAAVHDGAIIHPWGNDAYYVELPARPWTTAVLEGGVGNYSGPQYNFADEMQKKVGQFLK